VTALGVLRNDGSYYTEQFSSGLIRESDSLSSGGRGGAVLIQASRSACRGNAMWKEWGRESFRLGGRNSWHRFL